MRCIILLLLCSFLFGCDKRSSEQSSQLLQEAMEKLAAADTPDLKFEALGGVARQCFIAGQYTDAQKYAQDWLGLLPNFRASPQYGTAAHDANVILGRIAVRDGRLDDAKRHLMESVRTPGPRQVDYGPDMSLAKALLEKGETQAVLNYFAVCKRFWDQRRLSEWSQQVQDGQLPDFGPSPLD